MIYAIGEVSERIGLPISTIRYYHKNGLMPHVDRTAGGQRRFSDDDVIGVVIVDGNTRRI